MDAAPFYLNITRLRSARPTFITTAKSARTSSRVHINPSAAADPERTLSRTKVVVGLHELIPADRLPQDASGRGMPARHGLTHWLSGRVVTGTVLTAGVAGAVIAIAGLQTPARVPLVLIFFAAVPALAISSVLGGLDRFATVVIAGISTIVVDFGVAEAMIISGTWSLRAGVAIVAAVSALIAAAGLAARRIAPGPAKPSD